MIRSYDKTKAFFEKATHVMPYGVSSNYRYWGPEETPVIARGAGSHVFDLDGNELIDYRLGFGPIILGHGYPPVVERVTEAIQEGTIFAATHPWEVRVAEKMRQMCPCVELVRFANSGSEATMHALRVARAYTGREKIIKFEGQYHGMYDYMLFSTASSQSKALGHRRNPIPQVHSSGIPKVIQQLVIPLPFNDFEILEETVERAWSDVAAIIVEPILGNAAGIEPRPGWLELIRQLCDKYGMVMIMDEVKTGFRIAAGGAQEVYGVVPDLACYAKAMANGFPIAAFGGKQEFMEMVVPGQVFHGGTYCGNVAGTAAADATLEILQDPAIFETIGARGKRLQEGIDHILTAADIPHVIAGPPAMFGVLLTEDPEPKEFRDYAKADNDFYEEIITVLIENGAMPEPDAREPWFLCYSHSEEDIDDTLTYFEDAVKRVKRGAS
jgi:glutamate-1-semialdehyde 2,1-aminomutase